jgi:hypothetical protein
MRYPKSWVSGIDVLELWLRPVDMRIRIRNSKIQYLATTTVFSDVIFIPYTTQDDDDDISKNNIV